MPNFRRRVPVTVNFVTERSSAILLTPRDSVHCIRNREALGAAAAAAKSEVDRVRRQAKEAAETGRKDAEKAMEQQVTCEATSLNL